MKKLLFILIPVVSFILSSCTSPENKAKDIVEKFAKCAISDTTMADVYYPSYSINYDFAPICTYAKIGDIEITNSKFIAHGHQCDTCEVLADNTFRDENGNYKKSIVKFIVVIGNHSHIDDSYGLIQFSPEDGKILTKAGAIYDETTDRFIAGSIDDFKAFLSYVTHHSDELDIDSFTGKEYGEFLDAYVDYINKHRGELY